MKLDVPSNNLATGLHDKNLWYLSTTPSHNALSISPSFTFFILLCLYTILHFHSVSGWCGQKVSAKCFFYNKKKDISFDNTVVNNGNKEAYVIMSLILNPHLNISILRKKRWNYGKQWLKWAKSL